MLTHLCRGNSDSTGETRKSSTKASTSTKATSTGTNSGDNGNDYGQVAGNQDMQTTLPPPDPLIDGFGAQFANQLPPPPTLQEEEAHRQTRMRLFHDAFTQLGVYLPRDVLIRVENARYGGMAPETVLAQLAARYHHKDPMARWQEAEDVWNAITGRMRATLPQMGTLFGWEDLEDLSAQK